MCFCALSYILSCFPLDILNTNHLQLILLLFLLPVVIALAGRLIDWPTPSARGWPLVARTWNLESKDKRFSPDSSINQTCNIDMPLPSF